MGVATGSPEAATRPGLGTYLWFLVGVAGMTCGIALLFLGMRAVMEVGGMCASGGPYEIEVECPEGVPIVTLAGIWGGLAAAFLTGATGARIGGWASGVAFLGWPALFCSLGWNFLVYGLDPPGDGGWEWGWLICAAVFFVMGAGPLVLAIAWRDDFRTGTVTAQLQTTGRPRLSRVATTQPGATDASIISLVETLRETASPGLVDELERLAALRNSGDLTADEYAEAKRALLGGTGTGA